MSSLCRHHFKLKQLVKNIKQTRKATIVAICVSQSVQFGLLNSLGTVAGKLPKNYTTSRKQRMGRKVAISVSEFYVP